MAKLPRLAKLKDGRVIPLQTVQIGSILTVCTGDMVAIDGVVVGGAGSVDESSANGEYKFKEKKVGDQLMAGTMLHSG